MTKEKWEEPIKIWEMRTIILVNAKKQLTTMSKAWRLLKNWVTLEGWEEPTEVWEMCTIILVNTKKQFTSKSEA